MNTQDNEVFVSKMLQFEMSTLNTKLVPVPFIDPNIKFGILNFTAVSVPITTHVHDFVFIIDCSGSMSDICSDKRTKLQHIIHTLKNMIYFIKENENLTVYITVDSFDEKIYKIVPRTKVTFENFNEIIKKIDKILPRNSTNIELALLTSRERINTIKSEYPDNIICHVFMTDGVATDGNENTLELAELVDNTIFNSFIGVGIDHDNELLSGISSGENSGYYFIDKLEKSGLVYGEILHGIFYKFLKKVEITITNGYVYDFKTNAWLNTLKIGDIVGDSNKTYHIISNNPSECSITLTALSCRDLSEKIVRIVNESENVNKEIISKYIFRQRTLQLLYKCRKYASEKNKHPPLLLFGDAVENQKKIQDIINAEKIESAIKEEIKSFKIELKKYMTDNNLSHDKFYINLYNDLQICYKTFGTIYETMFITARQTSQGTQQGYNVSEIPDFDNVYPISNMRRQTTNILPRQLSFIPPEHLLEDNGNLNSGFEEEEEPTIKYPSQISDYTTPYLTPQAMSTMRSLSQGIEIEFPTYITEDDEEL